MNNTFASTRKSTKEEPKKFSIASDKKEDLKVFFTTMLVVIAIFLFQARAHQSLTPRATSLVVVACAQSCSAKATQRSKERVHVGPSSFVHLNATKIYDSKHINHLFHLRLNDNDNGEIVLLNRLCHKRDCKVPGIVMCEQDEFTSSVVLPRDSICKSINNVE